MKILVIGPADSPHTTRPVRSLLKNRHNVCFIGYHGDDPFGKEAPNNYTWHLDPGLEPFPQSDKGMAETFALLSTVYKIFKPDVVHIHWLSWHLLACAKIAPHVPVVVSIWGTDINIALEALGNGEYKWGATLETVNAKNLHLASHIIIDDPTMKAKCAFAAPSVPSTLLSLGADDFFFHPDSANREKIVKNLSTDPTHIFTSMRVVRDNYRSDDILRAFALGAKGKNAILVFKKFLHHTRQWVGLKALARKLEIEKQIRFCDGLEPENLRDLYSASTALINFPVRDGFPVSFTEAGAVGGDVITCWNPAYDVSLVNECFDVLPDDSIETLAEAIGRRLEAPLSLYPRNPPAIEVSKNQFSHAAYVRGLEDIYHNLTGDKI